MSRTVGAMTRTMRLFAARAAISVALVSIVGSAATAAPEDQQRIVQGAGAAKTASRGVPSEGATPATAAGLWSRWPVRGPITSDFGRRHPGARARFHAGIDIGVSRGTPVRVPAKGTVVFAGWRNGYGRTIIVNHGDRVHTLYGHLSDLGVSRGQKVKQDAVLGLTGTTGHASGPHLHYEILVSGRPVDPGPYLAAAPGVRRASKGAAHTATTRRVALHPTAPRSSAGSSGEPQRFGTPG
jgi:murein DD-endopeptidase MepM/ murein hydrolase activator NlpD